MHVVLRFSALSALLVLAAVPGALADPVLDWNLTALRTTAAAPFNPPLEARNLAVVHAAMFDAANAFEHEFRAYAVHLRAPAGASLEAAVIAAAHRALVRLYPEQAAALDALAAESLGRLPAGPGRDAGVTLGTQVAERLLALRAPDGAAEAITAPYTPGSGPGAWVPTPPAFRPALDPGWGTVAPFLLRTPSQFRPGPPPALTSRQYTTDFLEVRDVGSATSTTRTADQTALARLWISTAPQVWNPVARQLILAAGLGGARAARALALVAPGECRRLHRRVGCQVPLWAVAPGHRHPRRRRPTGTRGPRSIPHGRRCSRPRRSPTTRRATPSAPGRGRWFSSGCSGRPRASPSS